MASVVGWYLRRPRGGLGCIGAGEWTCGCGGQAAHTSSRDITKLRKYQESAKAFFFPGLLKSERPPKFELELKTFFVSFGGLWCRVRLIFKTE